MLSSWSRKWLWVVVGHEVRAVERGRRVVAADRAPGRQAGHEHLVAAGVAAVRVALRVADQDREVGLGDLAVHLDPVAHLVDAEVEDAVRVLGVVRAEPVVPELVDDGLGQVLVQLVAGVLAVQSDGAEQPDVALADAGGAQLFEDDRDAGLAVGAVVHPALDAVREGDDDAAARPDELADRLHPERVGERPARRLGGVDGGRVDVGLARPHDQRGVRAGRRASCRRRIRSRSSACCTTVHCRQRLSSLYGGLAPCPAWLPHHALSTAWRGDGTVLTPPSATPLPAGEGLTRGILLHRLPSHRRP